MAYKPQLLLLNNRLSPECTISVLYHDIFDYPLKESELARWAPGKALKLRSARPKISKVDHYYLLSGRENIVSLRLEKEVSSKRMAKALPKVKEIIENQNDILMAGITGSLAMNAASELSDIDLLIITKKGRLWTARLKTLFALKNSKIPTRRAGDKNEQNKLCPNIWMDESDLEINTKNAYTAHELAQIVPLINKNKTYEKLMAENKWILGYWPNAVTISNFRYSDINKKFNIFGLLIEKAAYFFQRVYMNSKMTREVVSPTRAFFHPMDWSKRVNYELKRKGVV